ncbi:MAG: pyridoxamine 5'-phosphate oxidase [Rhodocyclaceae bacterium]|nr:MAG: pyridoxamine 5'-phosphate oxidase [Rhodocyclaceae bacterium]
MERPPVSDIAFTPSVKAVQTRKGSRSSHARMASGNGWPNVITDELKVFIETQRSVFLATATAAGQPYIQHRGGPPGFLKVLDDETIAFADFKGNRQFITEGNLAENPRIHLFLIDYTQQQRVKIWGEAVIVEDNASLAAVLMPKDYQARYDHVCLITVKAWDANCPQHIPQRFDAEDVAAALAERDRHIAELEARLKALESP